MPVTTYYSFCCKKCGAWTTAPLSETDENGEVNCKQEKCKGKAQNQNIQSRCGRKVSLYPMHSDACGVHISQRKEAYDNSVKLGVPTEFDKEGCAIFRSEGHRKRYCEAMHYYDKDGGYGDPQSKTITHTGDGKTKRPRRRHGYGSRGQDPRRRPERDRRRERRINRRVIEIQ